jgi:hypothetical protein
MTVIAIAVRTKPSVLSPLLFQTTLKSKSIRKGCLPLFFPPSRRLTRNVQVFDMMTMDFVSRTSIVRGNVFLPSARLQASLHLQRLAQLQRGRIMLPNYRH